MVSYLEYYSNFNYFDLIFESALNRYFPNLFNLILELASPFITVIVVCLIVSFFARESLKFLSKL